MYTIEAGVPLPNQNLLPTPLPMNDTIEKFGIFAISV